MSIIAQWRHAMQIRQKCDNADGTIPGLTNGWNRRNLVVRAGLGEGRVFHPLEPIQIPTARRPAYVASQADRLRRIPR